MNNDTNRVAFEAAYGEHFEEATGRRISAEDMVSMRDGDSYGDRAYLNDLWKGWQMRDAQQPEPAVVAYKADWPVENSIGMPRLTFDKAASERWEVQGADITPLVPYLPSGSLLATGEVTPELFTASQISAYKRDAEKYRRLLAHWWELKVKFGDNNDPREIRAVFRVSTEVSHAGTVELDKLVADFCTAAQQTEGK